MRNVNLLISTALVVAACGTDIGATTTSSPTTTLAPTTTSAPATTTTSVAVTTTAPAPTTTSTLAGEPIDIGPNAGDELMVIGVRHDDVLNLRAGPGVGASIVDMIDPTYMGLIAEGNARNLPNSIWIEVDFEGTVGWVNLSFIGYAGGVDDQTAAVVADLGGTPTAATMTALGSMVAETFASDEEPESEITQVTPVTSGDLSEVTYDVVGFGDDAVRGVRVHVFGEQVSGGFRLKTVEVLVICGRGVDGEACV